MVPTMDQLRLISKTKKWDAATIANANSVIVALTKYGAIPDIGLDLPHRLSHFLAQLMHENGGFRYDKEVWGNTPAQKRYDTRKDLGNTPEVDGDGEKYKGRTGIQITGRANYESFRNWCRRYINPAAPDFVANPDLVNSDPWEGLGPIWFWSIHDLNEFADQNDIEMITRRINGGTNGLEDRLDYYTRTSLVLLGYGPTDIAKFQLDEDLEADNVAGPRTRAVLHKRLAYRAAGQIAASPTVTVTSSPVVQNTPVAVVPEGTDKPGRDIGAVVTAVVAGSGSQYVEKGLDIFGSATPIIQGVLIAIAVAALVYVVWGRQVLAARAKTVKAAVSEQARAGLPV